jgi:peptidoglycan/LPS O-acetylase OafA/YrhL
LQADKKNLIAIDILRAVAALGVMLYHQHFFTLIAGYTHIKSIGALDIFGAIYAVPLFFLISGYCIHLSNLKYIKLHQPLPLKGYYKRRFLRIYPAYLFALIVSILVSQLTGYATWPSYWDILIHLFCLQGFTVAYFNTINLVLWSITVEIAFYIIYPAFYYLRLKYTANVALLSTFIVSTVCILYFSFQPNYSLVQQYWVLNIWFAWCCGAYVADKLYLEPTFLNKPIFKLAYCVIVLTFIYLTLYQPNNLAIVYYQLKILIWTGPLVWLLLQEDWLRKHNNFLIKIIAYIGLSSYSLYLLHQPLISIKNFLVHQYMPFTWQKPAMGIGILFIPFIAWLSYKYIELPFMARKTLMRIENTIDL